MDMEKEVMKKVFIGTKNRDKLREIKKILQGYEIVSIEDIADVPDVIEDKDTIEGNAIKKAVEMAQFTGLATLSDDTGLFVRALDNRPGVYSARYGGDSCSYSANRDKMLEEMQDKSDRYAEFRTVVALADSNGLVATAFGIVKGEITTEIIGEGGFGYDPIFRVTEFNTTYSEMGSAQKSEISHRALAFKAIFEQLDKYFNKQ